MPSAYSPRTGWLYVPHENLCMDWESVQATGLAVPSDRPLDELTAELTKMLGDPGRRPTGIGEGAHLDAVAGLGRQAGSSEGLELVTGCVVERDADHAEL